MSLSLSWTYTTCPLNTDKCLYLFQGTSTLGETGLHNGRTGIIYYFLINPLSIHFNPIERSPCSDK